MARSNIARNMFIVFTTAVVIAGAAALFVPTATLDHKTTPKVKKTTKKVADAKIDTSEDPKKPVEEWSRVEIDVFLSKRFITPSEDSSDEELKALIAALQKIAV